MIKLATMDRDTEMSDQKILDAAIKIALKNGWSGMSMDQASFYHIYWSKARDAGKTDFNRRLCYGVIFSHEFAKAFWTEEEILYSGHVWHGVEKGFKEVLKRNWEYRLQQMVLEEDPIQYLAKFI